MELSLGLGLGREDKMHAAKKERITGKPIFSSQVRVSIGLRVRGWKDMTQSWRASTPFLSVVRGRVR